MLRNSVDNSYMKFKEVILSFGIFGIISINYFYKIWIVNKSFMCGHT